jgi:hypothetical protein
VGQAEHLGNVAEVFEHLRADAQDQHAFSVDPSDAGLGFQVQVVHERRPVRPLDHDLGPLEAVGDVALPDMPGAQDIAALVDMGGAGLERLERVVHARERLVLDAHALGRLGGDLGRLGRDGHDGLALEAHASLGQHGLRRENGAGRRFGHAAGQFHAERVLRHVGVREHRDDTAQRARLARVDADDARGGVGAADDRAVEHAGHGEVARVDGAAVDLLPGVRPGLGSADHAMPRWCEGSIRFFLRGRVG